jgi:2',3'-cyclic-nucleotide 2'-phosphodiesterase (5'-nucleotidase family)
MKKKGVRDMKKLCCLLALLLLLTGCAKAPVETGEAGWVSFDVFAVNDLHGKLADTQDQPGVDELSTYLEQAGDAILLSTGDMWQGSSESNLTNGFIITEWMNRMNFTAMTVGGHEFDWGEDWLKQNVEMAEFPFLGINVYNRQTNQRVDYCESSLVVDIDGVQVGIIGAIGDSYSSISPQHTKEIYFKIGFTAERIVDCIKVYFFRFYATLFFDHQTYNSAKNSFMETA